VASLSQGRTAAAQCGLFTHKSVPVIFEPACSWVYYKNALIRKIVLFCSVQPATELCPGTVEPLHKTRSVSAHSRHSCCLPTKCASSKHRLTAVPLGPDRHIFWRQTEQMCGLALCWYSAIKEQQKRCVGGLEGAEQTFKVTTRRIRVPVLILSHGIRSE